jgi:hypothetical protein
VRRRNNKGGGTMEEPTHKQHKILQEVQEKTAIGMIGKEDDIELYWELVRGGFLRNLVNMSGPNNWTFMLSDKAEKYLQ